jgi:integrase
VIGARWSEFNFDNATWTVPAERMKGQREHRVPLSDRAVELLRSLPRHGERVLALINSLRY